MLDKKIFKDYKEKRKIMEERVKADPFLPAYHIYPKTGWLNDPNGLCEFKGDYHIYYQYSPLDAARGDIGWGHVSTRDFISYKRHEPFIYPDTDYDKDGAYSGSAFIKNDKIYFFYTGNVKYPEGDGVRTGRDHNTLRIVSKDGLSYEKKDLIMDNDAYPEDMTRQLRDPKIYEKNGAYYMFIGARSLEDKGMVTVFKSDNLDDFSYYMRIETEYDFGYMWECPDFFTLDGKDILVFCPQGLESEEFRYQNIYQAGYFPIEIDLEDKSYKLGDFTELDYGFDFYAPQTFEDSDKRRILIGWMGMPDAGYTNPTVENDWQHCLTIPRVLSFEDGKLYQRPISELENLRTQELILDRGESITEDTYEALARDIKGDFDLYLREDVILSYKDKVLKLDMGDSSYGRDIRKIKINKVDNIRVFSDRSSLEIFINDGAYALTTRVYSKKPLLKSDDLALKAYRLGSIEFN